MTFSLIARCAETGQLGAVITTSNAAVGSRCCHLQAGVGGVLTQHRTDPRLGPRSLALLESGCTAEKRWRPSSPATISAGASSPAWTLPGERRPITGTASLDPWGGARGGLCGHRQHHRRPRRARRDGPDLRGRPHLSIGNRLLDAIEAGEAAGGETGTVHSAQVIAVGEDAFPIFDLRVGLVGARCPISARSMTATSPSGRASEPRAGARHRPRGRQASGGGDGETGPGSRLTGRRDGSGRHVAVCRRP